VYPRYDLRELHTSKSSKQQQKEMGNSQSLQVAETKAAQTKVAIDSAVDSYCEFLELTSSQIDLDIEDLGSEIAILTTQFRTCDEFKALPADKALVLQEDVEKYANLHKFSVRRAFAILEEAYDTFEDMCYAITAPDGEDEINFDDYESSEGEDDEEDDGEDTEEQQLDSEDDSEDADYNTQAAEEELAAELDSESDGSDSGSNETDYEDFEEVVTDDEVLYSCRAACKDMLDQYESEMTGLGLPGDLLKQRLGLLRRMLYKAAEAHVSQAVAFFVDSYRNAALEDIDNLLCLG